MNTAPVNGFGGEGDFTFKELLDSLDSHGRGLDRVLGLSYNTEDRHYHHNPSRPLEDGPCP